MLWVLENPARFLCERSALEQLCGEVAWIKEFKWGMTKDVMLKVDVDLIVGDEIYDVELVYPNLFPDVPAYVRPRTSTARWSSHQYGAGGVLCLEWGPDNWHPEITGADLLRSNYTLLSEESGHGTAARTVPSRHSVTFGQEVRASSRRVIVTSAIAGFLRSVPAPSHHKMVTHCILHDSTRVFFISEISHTEGESFRSDDLPSGIAEYIPLFSVQKQGWLFKSDTLDTKAPISNVESLLAAIRAAGFTNFELPSAEDGKPTSTEYLFLLLGPSHTVRALTSDIHGEGTAKEYTLIGLHDRSDPRLPPEHRAISDRKVGIVGLGSVGSKVAISLARSGVQKFLLIDDDVMLQGNVSRHELDWASVGVNKVDAVKEALSLVASGIDVQIRRSRIAGQESAESASTALDALATCDILIDATANAAVFVQLAAIAKRRKKPLVWGEVFAGGIGALLARSRPEKDPDPLSMRAAVHAYLQTLSPAPFVRATNYNVPTDRGPPLIAFDAEVTQFAAALTRFALDILLERTPSEFPYSAYLIGFKQAWVFDAPFDTRPISVEMPVAGAATPIANQPETQQAADVLLALIKQETHANADSSA